MPPKKKAVAKKKTANGYKMPDPLPLGEVLQDLSKKKWVLGPSIGKGGFGEIYSAKEADDKAKDYPYVVKIEPHENGPLFVEMHFYMRCGKQALIKAFQKDKGLSTFGMPAMFGSGSHEHNGEKYRFLVMEKYGTDLWKVFLENNKVFPERTVFQIAIQILDVLEYMHNVGYVHADIKGANILMGISKSTLNKQVFLVDFGLASKFSTASVFKADPKKAHDGTIEYLSRDAHKGVQTRRGDLEILAYNMIHWLGNTLPWEKLSTPEGVQKSKEDCMKSVQSLKTSCFSSRQCPKAFEAFLKYLLKLSFNEQPDYSKIRKLFLSGLKEAGGSMRTLLQFNNNVENGTEKVVTKVKRKSSTKISSPAPKEGRLSLGTKTKPKPKPSAGRTIATRKRKVVNYSELNSGE